MDAKLKGRYKTTGRAACIQRKSLHTGSPPGLIGGRPGCGLFDAAGQSELLSELTLSVLTAASII